LRHFRHPWRSDVAVAAYRDVFTAVPTDPSHTSLHHLASLRSMRLLAGDAIRSKG
jgi:hypothetical protein